MFFNGQPFRQNLLAQRVEQEGGFAVHRATSNRANQVSEQSGRHFIGENHWCFHGGKFTRRQAR